MSVAKFLDASTGYMTKNDSLLLANIEKLQAIKAYRSRPRVIPHEYGWWVNVQQEGDVYVDHIAALVDAGFSASFLKVMHHARKHGCWWINFDQDGSKDLVGLRLFNW